MDWNPHDLPSLAGRTYAVTGATAGIGYFAAEQLAAGGAHVVLAGRNAAKLETARASIAREVSGAHTSAVLVDLASLDSVADAAQALGELDRLDGILLNGGSMSFSATDRTAEGLPLLLGTHFVANVALVAALMPALERSARIHGAPARIVHTSTGFVGMFRVQVADLIRQPRNPVLAYTQAKAATEIFAFELERRLRAEGRSVQSLVARPGVATDANTPKRPGIRDASTPYQRNILSPWGQGKDGGAGPSVRALVDPGAQGGEYYAPAGRLKGPIVRVEPSRFTQSPADGLADAVWRQGERLARLPLPV